MGGIDVNLIVFDGSFGIAWTMPITIPPALAAGGGPLARDTVPLLLPLAPPSVDRPPAPGCGEFDESDPAAEVPLEPALDPE
jgi:hypothetical protein